MGVGPKKIVHQDALQYVEDECRIEVYTSQLHVAAEQIDKRSLEIGQRFHNW